MASTELSAETRERILQTAWAQVRQQGTTAVSVKDIAAAAGVSRQLIYFHYGNRAGLLLAMARHQDDTSGIADRVRAAREHPPAEAFERLVRTWCEYVPEILPVSRALEAALITGDDGATAWEDRFADLRAIIRHAIRRLMGDDLLAPEWDLETATDWAWAILQPANWDYLVRMRGWQEEVFVERTTRLVIETLISGPVSSASARTGETTAETVATES